MIAVAREHAPDLSFSVGSMLDIAAPDGVLAGAVAFYSIIHFTPEDRLLAFREIVRVLVPHGLLLVSFHVDSPDFTMGAVNHATEFFGQPVMLDGYFLDPAAVIADLTSAGLTVTARLDRQPSGPEYPSRRCYLIARKP